jgi:hypothetical protein
MNTQPKVVDELLAYLFDGRPHPLAPPVGDWLASSRRFTAFVTSFRPKIRKKIRTTRDPENLLDLRLELETACLLLREPSFGLVYEPPPSPRSRGPDFAVTFTTSMAFMLEVTRLRTVGPAPRAPAEPGGPEAPAEPTQGRPPDDDWLADTVCSKLGQLLPQRTNVLLIGVEAAGLAPEALRAAMLHLQGRAERNDPAIVQRYEFRDRAGFFRGYQRLSELLVRGPQQGGGRLIAWVNPQAKYPLPGRVRTALHRSLNG